MKAVFYEGNHTIVVGDAPAVVTGHGDVRIRKIDSHVHIWNIDNVRYPWPTPAIDSLYRNIEPDELESLLHISDISGAVLVQAADHVEETAYLLSMAEARKNSKLC